MEGRESMGLSGPGSFGAILHRGVSSPAAGMPTPASAPVAIHAPTALRPVVSSVISVASNPNNPSSAPYATESTSTVVPHGVNMGVGMAVGVARTEPLKRKRGRPRKYGPDGSMALALAPLSSVQGSFSSTQKRGRGRPPGSGRKQQLAALGEWLAGSAGMGFTPHVITIAAGEVRDCSDNFLFKLLKEGIKKEKEPVSRILSSASVQRGAYFLLHEFDPMSCPK